MWNNDITTIVMLSAIRLIVVAPISSQCTVIPRMSCIMKSKVIITDLITPWLVSRLLVERHLVDLLRTEATIGSGVSLSKWFSTKRRGSNLTGLVGLIPITLTRKGALWCEEMRLPHPAGAEQVLNEPFCKTKIFWRTCIRTVLYLFHTGLKLSISSSSY